MANEFLRAILHHELNWRGIMSLWPTHLRERWQERAAIMKFEGGLPLEQAERLAFEEVREQALQEDRRAASAELWQLRN